MYQVIEMYGDSEPWWFFEDWEQYIVDCSEFSDFLTAHTHYHALYQKHEHEYPMKKEKDYFLAAFWKEGDLLFCEDCDEDLQQYKGLLLLKNGKKITMDGIEINETTYYSGKTKCCPRFRQGTGNE
ncbi:DUF1033 family protein [Vagococcus lutrae]|uniref:DUF1033 family protein n=1 Tax=Vagococcus lutrae TaxID=81947 RepID=UPI001C984857|nr:DUF1033 family protein [Vagococcus lutrae]QZN89172.1 DUF1033 family protein [Vagococcus lutrae]